MVRKKNRKWQMCTTFTDLNKCCPKDDFPLTMIDQIIDSAAGYDIMALLDYFSGYYQIWLRKEDEEKTSFITPFGTYCYMRMLEGMRNAGPTFCRVMKAALKDQVGRNIPSYDDDIVVASKKKESYISDLTETFANMREANLKLNPEKCVFGNARQSIGISGFHQRYRGRLRQNKSNSPNATSIDKKRSAEVDRPHSSTQ
jgi:hypothetical protein